MRNVSFLLQNTASSNVVHGYSAGFEPTTSSVSNCRVQPSPVLWWRNQLKLSWINLFFTEAEESKSHLFLIVLFELKTFFINKTFIFFWTFILANLHIFLGKWVGFLFSLFFISSMFCFCIIIFMKTVQLCSPKYHINAAHYFRVCDLLCFHPVWRVFWKEKQKYSLRKSLETKKANVSSWL